MQDIEPHYLWRDFYKSEDDERSPFYEREYSEFEYTNKVYNYLLHPQWDEFGSSTLYLKILYVDYREGFVIIEMIGEWNDAINNDIMFLKRDVVEEFEANGINKFILIGENVLNFHASDDSYYEDWFQDVGDGWIVAINFQDHVLQEFRQNNIDYYLNFGGELDNLIWRKLLPNQVYRNVENIISRRLS
jgi:hypothetical protein